METIWTEIPLELLILLDSDIIYICYVSLGNVMNYYHKLGILAVLKLA